MAKEIFSFLAAVLLGMPITAPEEDLNEGK